MIYRICKWYTLIFLTMGLIASVSTNGSITIDCDLNYKFTSIITYIPMLYVITKITFDTDEKESETV